MIKHKPNLFLAAVMAFAISSSSCQMLQSIIGGGGGGGLDISSLLSGLPAGQNLTDDPQDSGMSLSGGATQVTSKYRVEPSNKALRRDASLLYGSY